MKKILISIVLALTLGLSLFAFVGCGSRGPVGPQEPPGVGCECVASGGCDCTNVSNCDCSPAVINRIYQLGQTFTYVNHTGMELFSIYVNIHPEFPTDGVLIRIENLNSPNFRVNDFVRFQSKNIGLSYIGHINQMLSQGECFNGSASFGSHSGNYIWFGFPINSTTIVPFVQYRFR